MKCRKSNTATATQGRNREPFFQWQRFRELAYADFGPRGANVLIHPKLKGRLEKLARRTGQTLPGLIRQHLIAPCDCEGIS